MDCVVIGTNLKNRFENLKKCTEFLDKYNFTIKNLTIDDFVENIEKDFSSFEKYGWNVFCDFKFQSTYWRLGCQ